MHVVDSSLECFPNSTFCSSSSQHAKKESPEIKIDVLHLLIKLTSRQTKPMPRTEVKDKKSTRPRSRKLGDHRSSTKWADAAYSSTAVRYSYPGVPAQDNGRHSPSTRPCHLSAPRCDRQSAPVSSSFVRVLSAWRWVSGSGARVREESKS